MRIHHLNCGTMLGGAVVSHCLLIERDDALVLIDTGYGRADIAEPDRVLGLSHRLLRPVLDPAETAYAQIEALGLEPRDVTDIVLTHLDYDHAGGLADFPWARVHVHDREYRAAMHPGRTGRVRYRREQYAHGPNWQLSQAGHGGDRWFGFAGVHELTGLSGLAMVPLYGHTTGHVGIAVNVDGGWLLHAGDAYLSALQLNRYLPGLLLGGAAFGDPDPLLAARRVRTAARLAALVQQHGDEVTVFCAHDAHAYGELARHNPTPSPESKEA